VSLIKSILVLKMGTKRRFKTTCLTIDDFGKGLCRIDGKTVFVTGLLPGEEGEVETYFVNGKLKEAKLIKRLTKSKNRIEPMCKYYGRCGSCNLQHLSYNKQLEYKTEKVKNLLHKFAGLDFDVKPTIGSNNPWNFRNKVQVPISTKKNKLVAGYYKENTHDLIDIEHCPIESKLADELVQKVIKILNDFKLTAYNTDTGTGIIRHILVKVSEKYNQALIALVSAKDNIYGINNIVKAIKDCDKRIVSIALNINTAHTNVILGPKTRVLYGTGKIKDNLCGLDFLISSRSFYQTNLKMTETLYNKAIELADIKPTDIVLDAYCGTGSIGLVASKYAKEVIGVELEKSSIKDAEENKKLNNINNISFVLDDCTKYILENEDKKFDIVILDPPRAGTTKEFIDAVQKIKPRKIVYVSCDPNTLARDLKLFTDYVVTEVQPVDMFPHSYHVETVVALSLKE